MDILIHAINANALDNLMSLKSGVAASDLGLVAEAEHEWPREVVAFQFAKGIVVANEGITMVGAYGMERGLFQKVMRKVESFSFGTPEGSFSVVGGKVFGEMTIG